MKRFTIFSLMMFLVAALMLPVSASAEKILKIGLGDPIDSDQGVLALRFKEIMEKTSGGKYKVDIFPAGQLVQIVQTQWSLREFGNGIEDSFLEWNTTPSQIHVR